MGKVDEPPKRIYLQWHGDDKPNDAPVSRGDVTWSEDRVYNSDVVYYRRKARRKPKPT